MQAWLDQRGLRRGASFTVEQQWRLASAWYSHRMDSQWRRRTPEEAEALFAELGLTGDFWRLTD